MWREAPLSDGRVHIGSAGCCPAHTVWEQLEEVERVTGVDLNDPAVKGVPLFPTEAGKTAGKKAVVEAWHTLLAAAAAA